MNKIVDLVNRINNEPVQYKTIKDVTKIINGYKSISKKDIVSKGLYPVIDQSQNYISGYTNNKDLVMKNGKYIVFGDHTREIKYIDFEFVPGDSGVKLLVPNSDGILIKYLFYALKNLKIPNRGYNRHWSILSTMLIPIPSTETQQMIVNILDKYCEILDIIQEEINECKNNVNTTKE